MLLTQGIFFNSHESLKHCKTLQRKIERENIGENVHKTLKSFKFFKNVTSKKNKKKLRCKEFNLSLKKNYSQIF